MYIKSVFSKICESLKNNVCYYFKIRGSQEL